eukprot:Trichotokara_eunicae@DN3114_c0_g1_i3.p1
MGGSEEKEISKLDQAAETLMSNLKALLENEKYSTNIQGHGKGKKIKEKKNKGRTIKEKVIEKVIEKEKEKLETIYEGEKQHTIVRCSSVRSRSAIKRGRVDAYLLEENNKNNVNENYVIENMLNETRRPFPLEATSFIPPSDEEKEKEEIEKEEIEKEEKVKDEKVKDEQDEIKEKNGNVADYDASEKEAVENAFL